ASNVNYARYNDDRDLSPRPTRHSSDLRSAAFGGNTTIMPFCLQAKGQSLREAMKAYHAKADGECYVDVSFHLIVADPTEQVLGRSEEHTSELQLRENIVCRLLLEKKQS